ncbi:MAG TPA: alanine racemase [Solirubrobacteraceae bacterium]|jgi:alanine racemase|nr:alanine racemase [Solirubrobacteraceae bacterium]
MVRALARVNLAAIERNTGRMRRELGPEVQLCAVVKAGGYGHGALPAARAALAGGASWLAVASAVEAAELRAAGIDGRILVMGAISLEELPVALGARADVVAWSEPFVSALAAAASERDGRVRVHVKLDTGMGRLGTRVSAEALAVAEAVSAIPALELAGAMTHFATADDPDRTFMRLQLERFEPYVATLRERHPGIIAHAANSAAVLNEPAAHFDLVRCGIALYGLDPMQKSAEDRGLEPALELTSYVAAVKTAAVGDSAGYGRRFVAERETELATLPIGYADGIRRHFTNNLDILIGARRHPVVGAVSMDNITVELAEAGSVEPGARATIIGADGPERQSAEELAARIGTINYEIVCGISARVPRHYHRDGVPA